MDREDSDVKIVLQIIVIGGSLVVQLIGMDGTEYGDWNHYGITNPLGLGFFMEFCFSVSFFCHIIAIIDAVFILLIGTLLDIEFKRSFLLEPSLFFLLGTVVWIIQLPVLDYAYWFNKFQPVELYNLQDGNLGMFIADEIPLYGTIIYVPFMFARRLLRFKKKEKEEKIKAKKTITRPRRRI